MFTGQPPTVYVVSRYRGLTEAVQSRLPHVQVKGLMLDKSGYLAAHGISKLRQAAEIILTEPEVIADVMYNSKQLKWAQCMYAGVEGVIKSLDVTKPYPSISVTRSPTACSESIAEYVLSHVLSIERKMPLMFWEQRQRVWNGEHYECSFRLLAELRLGIIGAGKIGTEICRKCKAVGMEVWGLSRTPKPVGSEAWEYDAHMTLDDLPRLLENCDYICNVLPSTPETTDLLSGDMLSNCRNKKSVFINIGRGNVVNEDSLVAAITNGWIGGAVLDVFRTEPLPRDSKLWSLPNVYITPHTSGQLRSNRIAELFVSNYKKFIKGEPLDYEIDWEAGY